MFKQEEWISLNFSDRNLELEGTRFRQRWVRPRGWGTPRPGLKAQCQKSCKEGKKLFFFVNYN